MVIFVHWHVVIIFAGVSAALLSAPKTKGPGMVYVWRTYTPIIHTHTQSSTPPPDAILLYAPATSIWTYIIIHYRRALTHALLGHSIQQISLIFERLNPNSHIRDACDCVYMIVMCYVCTILAWIGGESEKRFLHLDGSRWYSYLCTTQCCVWYGHAGKHGWLMHFISVCTQSNSLCLLHPHTNTTPLTRPFIVCSVLQLLDDHDISLPGMVLSYAAWLPHSHPPHISQTRSKTLFFCSFHRIAFFFQLRSFCNQHSLFPSFYCQTIACVACWHCVVSRWLLFLLLLLPTASTVLVFLIVFLWPGFRQTIVIVRCCS